MLDHGKAKTVLGWWPRLDMERTLSWTVDWYAGYLRGEDPRDLTLKQIEDYLALNL